MKRQNFSISTTRPMARRTASAFVLAPSAFRAWSMAFESTKKDLRVYRTGLTDVFPHRHTLGPIQAYVKT